MSVASLLLHISRVDGGIPHCFAFFRLQLVLLSHVERKNSRNSPNDCSGIVSGYPETDRRTLKPEQKIRALLELPTLGVQFL